MKQWVKVALKQLDKGLDLIHEFEQLESQNRTLEKALERSCDYLAKTCSENESCISGKCPFIDCDNEHYAWESCNIECDKSDCWKKAMLRSAQENLNQETLSEEDIKLLNEPHGTE